MKYNFYYYFISFILSIWLFNKPGCFAQDTLYNHYHAQEKMLCEALNEVYGASVDSIKIGNNKKFLSKFAELLSNNISLKYPFDSLGYISKINTENNNLRIFTWFIKNQDETFTYFGLIQYYNPKNKTYKLIELNDTKDLTNEPATNQLSYSPSGWYGALYYDLIEKKYHGNDIFLLLAYDLNNPFARKKIIETFSISDDGIILIGVPVIYYDNKLVKRVQFEYSAQASMSLTYNKDNNMVVFDHLSPSKPSLTGKYQFYGPDFSFDGLEFKDGTWNLIEDIDTKNTNIQ